MKLKTINRTRNIFALVTIFVLAVGYPLSPIVVYGQASTPSTEQSSDSSVESAESSVPPPPRPIGSSSPAYSLNEHNQWESKYYLWDSAARREIPKYQTSVLNPDTGLYDTYRWVYSPAQREYYLSIKKATPPTPAPTAQSQPTATNSNQTPTTATANTGASSNNTTSGGADSLISNTGPQSNNTINNPNGTATIDTTGPNSNNQMDDASELNSQFVGTANATINNSINGVAQSGDATVALNTQAGDAGTGDASNKANVINLLQSSWSPFDNGHMPTTFDVNLQGDVYGDMLINPGQSGAQKTSLSAAHQNYDVTIATNNTINNDITLNSTSGNATVKNNTTAGGATTGNATAMANVFNMINSMITAGESFVGTITIDGNFEGDILLPEGALDALLASNARANGGSAATIDTTGPDSTNAINNDSTHETDIDITNHTTIRNSIAVDATSGKATVKNNTSAGNASTGNASTDVNILNLSGQNFVTENSLLVFVNVFGEWIGIIMDAPVGATAAVLGGGVTSSSLPSSTGSTTTTVDVDHQNTINNNLNLSSRSGDALVANNTRAGDAATGNAYTSASIANVVNSQFSASSWFGVLFINILGDWLGSFNVNTQYGNAPAATGGQGSGSPSNTKPESNVKVFTFIPKSSTRSASAAAPMPAARQLVATNVPLGDVSPANRHNDEDASEVAAASISQPVAPQGLVAQRNWTPFIVSMVIASGLLATSQTPKLRGGRRLRN